MSLKKLAAAFLMAGTGLCGLGSAASAGEFDGRNCQHPDASGLRDRRTPCRARQGIRSCHRRQRSSLRKCVRRNLPKIQNDWSTGTNSIDVGVFAARLGRRTRRAGLLEDMDPYVAKDTKIDLNDIAPYFREFARRSAARRSC